MLVLGIDVGSTSIKGAVLDLDQGTVGVPVTRPFPAPLAGLPSGHVEIDPQAVVKAVEDLLTEFLTVAPSAASVCFCGQMGGAILVDVTARPLTNYISWRDQRTQQSHPDGGSYLDVIRRRWTPQVIDGLGNELQAGSASSLLFWLSQQGQLPSGATFTSITDYVIATLCGTQPRMHVTQAIGLLELRNSMWHREAFHLLGLNELQFPELSHSVEPVGTLGGSSIPVYGAFGDQQTALYGAGLQRGELSLNVSTGSQVSERTASFKAGRYQTRQYFDGDWLNTITHLPAGRSLNVLVDLLTELARASGISLPNPWPYIAARTALLEENSLDVDLAFFAGPLGSTGQIHGITTDNLTVGHLFHAAFRSMAENYATCAAWLTPTTPWDALVLSGGLTQSMPALRNLIQARFDLPLRESQGEEALLGLLALARTQV